MLSVREGVDGISIANQVRLERAAHAGSFLLVEGNGEESVFDRFCSDDMCSIVVCVGKPNLLEAIGELWNSGFAGALGVVDRDYFEFIGYPEIEGDLVYTEENDFDIMIMNSDALNKVMVEFGNNKRMTETTERKGKSVRELVFSSASVIGALRKVAQQNGWWLKFTGMNYRFEPKHSFMIDANSTVAHIYGRSRGNVEITEIRIRKYFHEELKSGIEAKRLCCGHDCVRVLGRGLRKAFGSTSQFNDEIGARTLEGILRVSYEWKHFQSTSTYRAMRNWEVKRGFRVFREDQ